MASAGRFGAGKRRIELELKATFTIDQSQLEKVHDVLVVIRPPLQSLCGVPAWQRAASHGPEARGRSRLLPAPPLPTGERHWRARRWRTPCTPPRSAVMATAVVVLIVVVLAAMVGPAAEAAGERASSCGADCRIRRHLMTACKDPTARRRSGERTPSQRGKRQRKSRRSADGGGPVVALLRLAVDLRAYVNGEMRHGRRAEWIV